MSAMASQITGISMVCWTVCSGTDQRKHQRSASLPYVRGIQQWPMNSPHKWPVTRKMFPFDDVIMGYWQMLGESLTWVPGERFQNTYELLNVKALENSNLYKNQILQCMSKIFCVKFQKVHLKFHSKYLTHTLKNDKFIQCWTCQSLNWRARKLFGNAAWYQTAMSRQCSRWGVIWRMKYFLWILLYNLTCDVACWLLKTVCGTVTALVDCRVPAIQSHTL